MGEFLLRLTVKRVGRVDARGRPPLLTGGFLNFWFRAADQALRAAITRQSLPGYPGLAERGWKHSIDLYGFYDWHGRCKWFGVENRPCCRMEPTWNRR
jgi:hypothetical protein